MSSLRSEKRIFKSNNRNLLIRNMILFLFLLAAGASIVFIGWKLLFHDYNSDYKDKKQPVDIHEFVIAQGVLPLYDGSKAKLKLVMTEGIYYTEEYAGGPGGGLYPENYEGMYRLQLYNPDGDLLDTIDLNQDWNYGKINFPGEFTILYSDYNEDQCPDFTIGNYGSSNGDIYFLYTITKENKIKKIFKGSIFEANRTSSLVFDHDTQDGLKQFMTYPYNNATGNYEHCIYTWDDTAESFILSEVIEITSSGEKVIQDHTSDTVKEESDTIKDDNTEKISDIKEDTSKQKEHLDFYEEFGMYNSAWDYFKGFVLSEERIDGELFYQLLNEDKDVRIVVDRSQEKAVIYHAGKSMDYPMEFLLSGTSAHTAIDVMDITKDGKDELIIYHGMGGTGVWEGRSDVINLETLETYEIDKVFRELGSRITVELTKNVEDDLLLCKITDHTGNNYHTLLDSKWKDIDQLSYTPREENSYYHISVDYDKKCLAVSMGIKLDPMINYIGELKSWLEYHPESNHFELSKDYTVELFDPYAGLNKKD